MDNNIKQCDSALASMKHGLLQPTSRELATKHLLEYVKNNKVKLPAAIIKLLSQMLPDKNIEIISRRNIAYILTDVSTFDPEVLLILDKNLGDEDLVICKIIMGKFYCSDYQFKNMNPIESNLLIPDLKLLAISLICKAVIKHKMNLQDSTVRHLNQLLHEDLGNVDTKNNENITIVKYIIAVLINRTDYLLSDMKGLEKLFLHKELLELLLVLLNKISISGQSLDYSLLAFLCKITTDKNFNLHVRKYLLNILLLQISIHDNLSNFTGFSFLTDNFNDENESVIEQSVSIFISGLKKENMLGIASSTELKDIILTSNSLNRLNELLKQSSLCNKVKDDITVMLSLSKDRPQRNEITYPLVKTLQKPLATDQGEKDVDLLLTEIAQLNQDNKEITNSLINNGLLKIKFNEIMKAYESDSALIHSGKNISDWNIADVQNWLNKFTTKNNDKSFLQNILSEIIAVVKRVNCIIMNQKPRSVQILSVLLLLLSPNDKGRLVQIATGEGKSSTVAILAAVLALQGDSVDVITSSPLLAKRDAAERKEFFSALNLIGTHNIDQQFHIGPKQCYKANIVYGDVGSFQYDLLRHEYKGYNTRGIRNFDYVIIDEVDSMLIDENSKLARLASHIAGTEYLEPLLVTAWFELANLHKHLVYTNGAGWLFIPGSFQYEDGIIELLDEENEQNIHRIESSQLFCKENIVNYLTYVIQHKIIQVPSHLEEFALSQVGRWAESAFQALHMEEEKHYIIIKDKAGNNVIAPVDYYNTGIVQENTKWTNGLHQFLQIKHGLKLTAEDFNTSFISNLGYFKRYGHKIFGVTGTLGSKFRSTNMKKPGFGAQDLLTYVYPIDLAFVPTFKKKIFTELEGKLIEGEDEWLIAISTHVIEQVNKNRAVLVICETISKVNQIERKILDNGYPTNKIKRYSRNDNDECLSINDNIDSGEIIIATNLAGRGTDIKTSETVEKSGGLHVCVTFLPDNLRVEEQSFGRTSRQGKKGTAILIINKPEALLKLNKNFCNLNNINDLKTLRNETEYKKLLKVKNYEIDKIETDDLLFSEFVNFTQLLRSKENNKYKLMQLDERWGLWLKQIQEELHTSLDISNEQRKLYALNRLESFKDEIGKLYFDNDNKIMQNPAYLIMEGFNMLGLGNCYHESIKLFTLANNLDTVYSFPALYNRAYAYIREGYSISVRKAKFDQSWQCTASEDLMMAREQISEIIIPQLHSTAILLNNPDSALFKQTITKIDLLKLQIKYMDSTIDAIRNCKLKNIIGVNNVYLLKELFNEGPIDEINELNAFGIHHFFDVKEIEPTDPGWGIFVFITGVIQIAFGALCVIGGFLQFGAALISEGMKDIYTSIQIMRGEPFNPKDYFKNKAINLAITLAEIGIETVNSRVNGSQFSADKARIQESITTAGSGTIGNTSAHLLTRAELAVQTIKEVAIRTVVNVGIDGLANNASKAILKAFTDNIAKRVNSRIRQCFDEIFVKHKLTRILAIDAFNYHRNYRRMIYRIVSDILSNKRSIVMSVAFKLMQMYSSIVGSSDFKVKLAQYTIKIGQMINNLYDLSLFIGDFCDSFVARLTDLEQKLPKLNNILYEHMKPRVNMYDVNGIIEKLTQGSVVNNNEIVQTNIHAINVIKFDEYKEYKPRVVELCERLHAMLFTMDYSQDIDQLYQDITLSVRGQLTSRLQGELVFPIIREAIDPVSQLISEKLIEASRRTQYVLQNVQTIKKTKSHNENELDAIIITDEGESVKNNRECGEKMKEKSNKTRGIRKQKTQKEDQIIIMREDLEDNIFGKPVPPMLSLHGITPAHYMELLLGTAQEETTLSMKKYERLLDELEHKVKFQTGFQKEFTFKKIIEMKQIIERSNEKYNFNEVLNKIEVRWTKRWNQSVQDKLINFLTPSPWLAPWVEDFGDLMIYGDKRFTRWSDEQFTDFKISYSALMSMGIERGISFVENIIGEKNVQRISKFMYNVDEKLDQFLEPGERATLGLVGTSVCRPLYSVTSTAMKKSASYIVKSSLKKTDMFTSTVPTLNKAKISSKLPNALDAKTVPKTIVPASRNNVKGKTTIGMKKTIKRKGRNNSKNLYSPTKTGPSSVHSKPTKPLMEGTGTQTLDLNSKHKDTIRNFVINYHNVTEGPQLDKLTKFYQKQFIKYQRWNARDEQAYWKFKIVGNPQNTHTNKHARVLANIAIEAAKDPNVILVSMDQGVKKILGLNNIKTNFRPDVIVIRKNGLVNLYEVRSKSDCSDKLMKKMLTIKASLPRMEVIPEVIEIPGITYKK